MKSRVAFLQSPDEPADVTGSSEMFPRAGHAATASRRNAGRPDRPLSVLICLHSMVLGGDIINAIDIAACLRARGHRVCIFSFTEPDGSSEDQATWALSRQPALELATMRGLPVLSSDHPMRIRNGPGSLRQLADLLRSRQVDVVHAFGDGPVTRWVLVAAGLVGVPLVVNEYKMSLSSSNPRRTPLVVGTRRLLDEANSSRPGPNVLVEPPVDMVENAPGAVDGHAFRQAYGLADDEIVIAIVSRFERGMKLPGITAAIDAVGHLDDASMRLVLVGGGEAETEVQARADAANRKAGRRAVVVVGALVDPRPAYAAADIVLGMGHSVLRAMAFGKPVVVLGEGTFSLPLSPDSFPVFRYEGFYGRSKGGDLSAQLAQQLRPLVQDSAYRRNLGEFARQTVERYSLESAVDTLEATYLDAIRNHAWPSWLQEARHIAVRRLTRGIRKLPPGATRTIGRLRVGNGRAERRTQ